MSENKQKEKELIERFIGNLFAITDGIVPVKESPDEPVHLYYERAIHELKEYWMGQLKVRSEKLIEINSCSKEQEQDPSAKEVIERVLNDLRITCLGCNRAHKLAELRVNTFYDKISCPNCSQEFKTLKLRW